MGKYKPNLEAFMHRPDLTFVLDSFNYIEEVLTRILTLYIGPSSSRKQFVQNILLNNSIVSFGAKLKLFFHVNATEKWIAVNQSKYHRLLQIRNQFAHSGKQCVTAVPRGKGQPCEGRVYLMLESVSGSGKLDEVESSVALDEFTQLFVDIREELHGIMEKQENG